MASFASLRVLSSSGPVSWQASPSLENASQTAACFSSNEDIEFGSASCIASPFCADTAHRDRVSHTALISLPIKRSETAQRSESLPFWFEAAMLYNHHLDHLWI